MSIGQDTLRKNKSEPDTKKFLVTYTMSNKVRNFIVFLKPFST